MPKTKKIDEKTLRNQINEKHIRFYSKAYDILDFILSEVSRDIKHAEYEFLDMPKNAQSTIDFLISAIGKVQKGERLALGMDDINPENIEPEINIIEGLSESKI